MTIPNNELVLQETDTAAWIIDGERTLNFIHGIGLPLAWPFNSIDIEDIKKTIKYLYESKSTSTCLSLYITIVGILLRESYENHDCQQYSLVNTRMVATVAASCRFCNLTDDVN